MIFPGDPLGKLNAFILKRAENSVFQPYNLNARFRLGIDVSQKPK